LLFNLLKIPDLPEFSGHVGYKFLLTRRHSALFGRAMHIDVVLNRGSALAILLRQSYREDGKTKKRTLANLSDWPAERIEQLRAVLRGERLLPASQAVEIVRSLPQS
jgi:hypothetical protein